MIKDIVVNLPICATGDRTTPFARSVAEVFGARLTGVAFVYEPDIPAVDNGVTAVRYIREKEQAAQSAAAAAVERLIRERRDDVAPLVSQQIRTSVEDAAGQFAAIARSYDVSIVAQPGSQGTGNEEAILEGAVFQSGRPVLAVPYIQSAPFSCGRALICWDGSAPAARAIGDAMTFLRRAAKVDILTVDDGRKPGANGCADMVAHLARHGVRATATLLPMAPDVASAILNYAADTAPDLIVMGAYSRTRLSEVLLGGTTRAMLQSMTSPTLMAH